MPNYHLVMQKKDKTYQPIEFTKISTFNDLNEKKLPDIIKFTGFYGSEDELKYDLLHYNLIKQSDYNDKLCVIYKYNKENRKLRYGITYKDDLKFFSVDYLRQHLKDKIDDLDFLEKLSNHYRSSYIQPVNLTIIKEYINSVRMGKIDKNKIDKKNQDELQYALNDFVIKEVYDYKTGKIKYKNLRDLAMFTAYQERKKKNKFQEKSNVSLKQAILEQKEETEEFLAKQEVNSMYNEVILEENIETPKIKQKKKTKKNNKNIPGQLNFQDIGWL